MEAGFADQLAMLNYDMHVGVALGLPGKILAFFVSLICASLPVTGFMVWLNKKKKSKKSGKRFGCSQHTTVQKWRFCRRLGSKEKERPSSDGLSFEVFLMSAIYLL